ncbi:hypothetical protein V6N13_149008 [Hibiscus sabdariffa]|uniref:Uncharacterized protein n=2 Tax=Hibiscus sabdariffa TaxID=183260 RepID=A0ABR1ZSP0_9ROSI
MATVECLRGRLLAERQASKTAKQDAHLMESKLLELENKLKEETKLRNKAEKRLKLLKKKLESLKILPDLEESERSSSSESSAVSSLSSASSSGSKDPQESASMSPITVPEISENVKENAPDTKSDTKESSYEKFSSKSSSSSSSLEPSTTEINTTNYEEDDEEYVDNSLALVPLEFPETKPAPEMHIVSKSVGEVLDSLRHARERIQSSMGRTRRQMIRVGP